MKLFEEDLIIKFHEDTSSGSRVVLWGRADGRTDMTKIIAFRNFAISPKNRYHFLDPLGSLASLRLWCNPLSILTIKTSLGKALKLRKKKVVRLSVRMEHFGFHWSDFRVI